MLSFFLPRRSLYGVVISIVCILFIFSGCKSTHSRTFEPGTLAPDFTITDATGKQTSLHSLKGKVVVVVLWATWCETCKSQIPSLERLTKRYPASELVVLAPIVMDSKDSYKKFISSTPLTYLTGTSQEDVASLYKITGVPESFVVDKEGKLVLMKDLSSAGASVRILGPRDWDSGLFIEQFERILRQ